MCCTLLSHSSQKKMMLISKRKHNGSSPTYMENLKLSNKAYQLGCQSYQMAFSLLKIATLWVIWNEQALVIFWNYLELRPINTININPLSHAITGTNLAQSEKESEKVKFDAELI